MKLNNLQILRGLAALLVCCFHFREDINFASLKLGNILFRNGSIGVPIFFVISGFIMNYTSRNLSNKEGNYTTAFTNFFKRRLVRIVPLYYLLTFLWIISSGTLVLYFTDPTLWSRLVHSLLFLPQKDSPPVLFLGWSLNYEMFFYLVFGFSILWKRYRIMFIITFFTFFYILGQFTTINHPFWTMLTSGLNLYFIMGIIFSLVLNTYKIQKNIAIGIASTGILLFALFYFNLMSIKNELLQLAIVSSFVFAFLLADYNLKKQANKAMIFIGDISYSLYLSHPFVEVFMRKFKPEGLFTIPFFLFKIGCAISLASILYILIEKKITNYLKAKLKI